MTSIGTEMLDKLKKAPWETECLRSFWREVLIGWRERSNWARVIAQIKGQKQEGPSLLKHWWMLSVQGIQSVQFGSVQLLSPVQLFATPWIAARQASLSITNSWSSSKLICIKSVMPSSHLIFCHPLLLLPPIPLSNRVFSNESTLCMRWPEYWSFSLSISPSSEYSGLLSFRMNWLNLLAVQGTLKSLSPTPQFKSIPSLVLSFLYSPTLTSIHDYW